MMEKPQERRETSAKERGKPLVKDLNQHIVCPLCRGYLIDAITLVECLHSFCRGCIVQRFREGPKTCPVCKVDAVAPLVADIALQRLVYLVVPGLFRAEQERRRNFRKTNPNNASNVNQAPLGAPELSFDDLVSLSLSEIGSTADNSTRYLKCPAGVTVRHLLRLLMLKRGWDDNDGNDQCGNNKIEMMYDAGINGSKNHTDLLDLSWTLMDLACIFEWKKEAPMKLLYRIVRVDDGATNKSVTSFCSSNTGDASSQAIENIQRPPTPPPSPKPTIYRGDSLNKSPRSTIVVDQYETKKPRCEVSPLMRAPDPPPIHDRSKANKLAKLEHKRKKRKNKRVIAEITTTPREDLLKLKVRLTPVPTRVTTSTNADGSHSKDKLLQMRAVRKDKTKSNDPQKHRISKEQKVNTKIEEDKTPPAVKETPAEAQKVVSPPEKPVEPVDNQKSVTNTVVNAEKEEKPEEEEAPKNEEVLRRLGLVAISEANKTRQEKSKNSVQANSEKMDPAAAREKLEKQLRESKANRVRSLLAEKQMRDTLKSMMSNTKEASSASNSTATASTSPSPRCETPTTSHKRKDPPPLTPLRSTKRPNVTFAPGSFTPGKFESPLDLSSPSNTSKDNNALDLSANVPDPSNSEHKPVSILRNSVNKTADKPKDDTKKPQESNLKTLSDAAVSLLGGKPGAQVDKSTKLSHNFMNTATIGGPMMGGKVALRIPQPHQRLTGFGMKIKPNIGVRHIPNPQAIVASQYRNQRTGYYSLAQQPP